MRGSDRIRRSVGTTRVDAAVAIIARRHRRWPRCSRERRPSQCLSPNPDSIPYPRQNTVKIHTPMPTRRRHRPDSLSAHAAHACESRGVLRAAVAWACWSVCTIGIRTVATMRVGTTRGVMRVKSHPPRPRVAEHRQQRYRRPSRPMRESLPLPVVVIINAALVGVIVGVRREDKPLGADGARDFGRGERTGDACGDFAVHHFAVFADDVDAEFLGGGWA
ncbi:hypothetical protein B0H12DRAFT_288155 [Mycena haematopus]|nr:hypothetical protein B0H12DRAFT_288155 [Mycena haematopus]